jgi:hypothetical protein
MSRHSPPTLGGPELLPPAVGAPEPVKFVPPAVAVGDGDGDGCGDGFDPVGDGVGDGDGDAPVAPPRDRLGAGRCDFLEAVGDAERGRLPGSSSGLLNGGATAAAIGVPCPEGPLACGPCILIVTDTRRM